MCVGTNLKGDGRGLFEGTIPVFTWRVERARIRMGNLQKRRLGRYHCINHDFPGLSVSSFIRAASEITPTYAAYVQMFELPPLEFGHVSEVVGRL
jgi:hypothetical protein